MYLNFYNTSMKYALRFADSVFGTPWCTAKKAPRSRRRNKFHIGVRNKNASGRAGIGRLLMTAWCDEVVLHLVL